MGFKTSSLFPTMLFSIMFFSGLTSSEAANCDDTRTVFKYWNRLRGSDDIVSIRDLEKELSRSNPETLKRAIAALLIERETLNDLDVAFKGGSRDGKISTNDMVTFLGRRC